MGLKSPENRPCVFVRDNGKPQSFNCSSYEYCCGQLCCRPSALTFNQLWYFWLTVVMVMLLCSGGRWWYRMRQRFFCHCTHDALRPPEEGQLDGQLSQGLRTASGHVIPPHLVAQARGLNVQAFYYPDMDRIYFHGLDKDDCPELQAPPAYGSLELESSFDPTPPPSYEVAIRSAQSGTIPTDSASTNAQNEEVVAPDVFQYNTPTAVRSVSCNVLPPIDLGSSQSEYTLTVEVDCGANSATDEGDQSTSCRDSASHHCS